jgi:hypothetical protein
MVARLNLLNLAAMADDGRIDQNVNVTVLVCAPSVL